MLNLKKKYKKMIIIGGDFNVCHKDIDFDPHEGDHMSPSTTPGERSSFGKIMNEADLVDAFRCLHP